MSMSFTLRSSLADRRGTSSVEFALIGLLFFTFIFLTIDFGRAMWDWNAAAKATHWGARFAVVHDMVPADLYSYDGLADAGGNGLPVPIAAISPNPIVCTSTGCNGYGFDQAAFDAIVQRMQAIDNRIQAANVVVEYRHIGLGFAGNPFGPDILPAVTVRLQGMVFSLITPGVANFATIPMPAFATTLIGESLQS